VNERVESNRRSYRRLILAVVLGGAAGFAAVSCAHWVGAHDHSAADGRRSELEALIAINDERESQIGDVAKDLSAGRDAEDALVALLDGLPDERAIADLQPRIEQLAEKCGARIESVETHASVEEDVWLRRRRVTIDLLARYGSLRRFLDALAASASHVRIDSLRIASITGDARHSLRARLCVTYFATPSAAR